EIGNVKLSAHPESFQLDKKNGKLYVNLPEAENISVIDLKSFKIVDTWKLNGLKANFPMTLNTSDNQVIVGFRHPAVLVVFNNRTGKQITRCDLVGDTDDVFYDEKTQQVFASGGEGFINVFKKQNNNSYKKIANISTRSGARTSFLISSLRKFVVAERAAGGKGAGIAIYS